MAVHATGYSGAATIGGSRLETSYTKRQRGSVSPGAGQAEDSKTYWNIGKLRKCYTDYLFSKREEIDEQIDARRYYHGSQYTSEQIRTLNKRKQPIMTFNRIARKVDGVVGLLEKLRQDPKGFARTPKHEQGAELVTAAIRYVLDENDWKAESACIGLDGAVDGIGGLEMSITQGDQGDPDISFDYVDGQSFFYDPRSYREDFSDARYMGVGKWLDKDIAEDLYPDADADAFSSDMDLTTNSDREMRWFTSEGITKRVRVIEIWYKTTEGWKWAVFTGNAVLDEGESPFISEKKESRSKYIMFSANVDQDGDRYGFIRNMKSAQDGINAKQSKMQHIIASKRLILSNGAVEDIERVRSEWARADGVVITNRPVNEGVKVDDQSFDFMGLAKLLELNLSEIENYGPNPALIGQGIENKSGRAIALLQQAGIADLGPYILAYRGWKIRVYREIWYAIRKYWKAERWIRVTDDDNLSQFVQINGIQQDPFTGAPMVVNAIGSLDVDVILDEAPDANTLQEQSFEVLKALGPSFVEMMPEVALELAPLDTRTKKMIRDKLAQSAQAKQPAQQIEMAQGQAKVGQTQADTELKKAQTAKAYADANIAPLEALMSGQGGQMQPQEYEPPPELQNAKMFAETQDKLASAAHKQAQARKTHVEADLAPAQMQLDQANEEADRAMNARNAELDRREQSRQSDADRKIAAKKAAQKPQFRSR